MEQHRVTTIGFYHLTRSNAEEALAPLLGRTLDGGARAVVRCGDVGRVAAVDAALWRMPEPSWLPHGTAADGHAEAQPVWLTATDEVPNGATFLFLLDNRDADDAGRFDRVFDLFDGRDEAAVAAARRRWSRYKGDGHDVTYWRQDAKRWIKAG